ncbi:MAG: Rpn family recombination-promoting nuclease/putative transposase [Candidatus Sericytochromatia bacterium]
MTDYHDLGYRKLFKSKTIFTQFLKTFVKEEFVEKIDFNELEYINKTYISKNYQKTESDVIYKTKIQDKEAYLYVLLEFQSTVDNFMALRCLNYITNFYIDLLLENKYLEYLPPIFPIVLYNGDKKWTAPENISSLIKNNKLLGKYGINFRYLKIAENEYKKEDLIKIKNIVSNLFMAEAHFDIDEMIEEISNLADSETDKEALDFFINWFKNKAIYGKIDYEYERIEEAYLSKIEVKQVLLEVVKEKHEKIKLEGKLEGESIGIQKGKLEGKIEGIELTAINMIKKGCDNSFINEITGLSFEKIEELRKNIS